MAAPFSSLQPFLDRLALMDREGQSDAIGRAVIESGGTYVPPSKTGSHIFEISLMGVVGRGGEEGEAIDDWRRAALCLLRHQKAA